MLQAEISPPDASHRTLRPRSFFQFRAGERMPEEDFHLPDNATFGSHRSPLRGLNRILLAMQQRERGTGCSVGGCRRF